MENKNELKIELYSDKEPRLSFDKTKISKSQFFFSKICSLSPDKELAFINSNTPVLNGFFTAHTNHYPIRIRPDDLWLLICQSFSNHINENSEKLRTMFVNFEGKKDISIDYDLSSIEQVDIKVAEDFSVKVNEKLKEYLGEEIMNILTPNFSTTTKDSMITCKITIMSSFKKFFNYKMMLCGCGIPYIILEGTAEDYKKIISKANELKKYDFAWYIDRIIPHIQKMVEAKEGKVDISHFKNIVQKKEKTESIYRPSGIEPEDVEFDYLEGWFLKFFAYYAADQYITHYTKFDGDSIKVKEFNKLANQILVAPFTIIDLVHNKNYEMQFKVGFAGCDQNEKNEVFPVMGWSVLPYDGEDKNKKYMVY